MTGASDSEVIALLKRYKCPTPFHEVRTRFLGNIVSPVMGASPMETVKQLWGGGLNPDWATAQRREESMLNRPLRVAFGVAVLAGLLVIALGTAGLLNVLVAGLWNRLTAHQSSRNPFRLMRFDVAQTREGLKHFALVRRQELDGFVEGLFGPEEHIDLPERAHEAPPSLATGVYCWVKVLPC